jgi:hypothetical protein
MRQFGWPLAFLIAFDATAMAADEHDPLVLARLLYNQRDFQGAVAAADQARLNLAGAASADLIAARAYLERFRESAAADDLTSARERLRRVDPQRFGPRERVEYIVGLGETLYLDGSYGAAADVFDSVLALAGALIGGERERVVDWWASALDRDARPRTDFERQAVYRRLRDRMHAELAAAPTSAAAVYWLGRGARTGRFAGCLGRGAGRLGARVAGRRSWRRPEGRSRATGHAGARPRARPCTRSAAGDDSPGLGAIQGTVAATVALSGAPGLPSMFCVFPVCANSDVDGERDDEGSG